MKFSEKHFTDDLKENFRSWETGHDNEQDAHALFAILMHRHPTESPELLKEWAFDWVGYQEPTSHNTDRQLCKT